MEHDFSRIFKKGITILCAVSAMGFGSVVSAYASSPSASSSKSLVALGDSITFGYNLQDTQKNTVPSRLAYPMLIGNVDNMSVSDLGVPGFTTSDLIHALQTPDFTRAIRSASVITLDIGSNDLIHLAASQGLLNETASSTSTTLTDAQNQALLTGTMQVGKNLGTIISDIRKQTNAPILFYNLYNPYPDGAALHAPSDLFEAAINQTIEQIAASSTGISVVDAHKEFDHNQMTYVRVLQGDIHPTILGQQDLAKLGEVALSPLLPHLKTGANAWMVQMAGDVKTTGGVVSANLLGANNTLTVPAGSLSGESEFFVTSTTVSGLSSIVPVNEKVVAEGSVHFNTGVTLTKPYTLIIKNDSITSGAAVYQVEGNKFSLVPGAKVSYGQAVIPAISEGDFVVVEPTVTEIPGATKPETGFPAFTDGIIAFLLIGLGGALVYASRRKREI